MKKIVIADDNSANRYFLEALFKGEGYETFPARDGAEALDLARRNRPDAIITDILMPVMDGFELCRVWKGDPALKGIPFIVYTATYTDPKDEELMLKLGADRFLIKPMQPEEMSRVVREVLAENRPRAPEISGDEMEGLKRYNEVLFHKLEQKIRELEAEVMERRNAEEKLLRTVDSLARTSAELDKFSAASYHDMQEPLRMITSYLQLLEKHLEGKLDGETRGYINTVIDGAKRMSALVKGIIDYSKVDRPEDTYEKVELDGLVDGVIARLKADKRYAAAVIKKSPLPRVLGSRIKMEQLWDNLLDNAMKFVKPGGIPEVTVSVEPKNGEWLFCVKDNGIGVEHRYFSRIFVLFQKLHTKMEYEGNGIGLALCKKIVEFHGGSIWVESDGKNGSAFYFTLPAAE